MAYTKGESGNINGRKPGSKNVKVKEWEILRDSIIGPHTQRFNEILEKSDDDKFCELFLRSINYFKPKLSFNKNEDVGTARDEIKLSTKQIDKLLETL